MKIKGIRTNYVSLIKTDQLNLLKWAGVCYLIILGFLSLNPWLLPDSKKAVGFITWDLIDHFIAYAFLSILLLFVLKPENKKIKTTVFVVFISSLIGVLLEFGQHWLTSNRQFSLSDIVANMIGALLGVIVFWCFQFVCKCVSQ